MINIFALSSLALITLHMAVAPASAHGYVSQPPSRQALCKTVPVPHCGDVKYEPQSVEAPKGSFECNGNGKRFAELNKEALWKNYFTVVKPGSAPLSFTWTLTAPHKTSTWEYFILTQNNTKLISFDDGGAMPKKEVVHKVPLKGYTGRQTILARWNIYDTAAAFYACVDLDIKSTQLPIGTSPSVDMPLQNVLVIDNPRLD